MKKLLVSMLLLTLIITGCTEVNSVVNEDMPNPVEIEEAKVSSMSKELYYTGVVNVGQVQKLAFKTGGIIEEIPVEVGDKVIFEQKLAVLDTSDIEFGLRAAEATLKAAMAQYNKAVNGTTGEEIQQASLNVDKAKEAFELTEQTYNQVAALYEKGAVSKYDLDQVKTQMEVDQATYEQALSVLQQANDGARQEDIMALQAQVEAATVDVERYQKMIDDSIVYSPFEGYVVEVLFDENEIIDAGYPVVVVRDEEIIVQIGASQKDINELFLGKEINVVANQQTVKGTIGKIADVPDETTKLYKVEIELEGQPFKVGSIVEVTIPIETSEGVWIPIQYIKIDSEEYVYIVEEEQVKRKSITIENNINDYALVTGIDEGDLIIVKGDKNVEEDDHVIIVE
ncbi:HlyD family secretion protein [Vallitalea okinawensis]|uniref:HlyD family secretion protein n=1 Tax=Vallitalea okinawensis TaxID=2078660 RepID=UPI000CFB0C43|nr:HlyD family efflux transporter periplasmic adaptor subunit [Vallitalea okinawensis]